MRKKLAFKLRLQGEGPKKTLLSVQLTGEMKRALGIEKARLPIAGTADGKPFRTSASPMGGHHFFVFTRELQSATGKGHGDEVRFVLWRDEAPRTVEVPEDLAAALQKNAKAAAAFEAFAYTHRKEYVKWVEGAKKPETRETRIAETVRRSAEKRYFS